MKILLAIDETPASQIAVEEIAGLPWPDDTTVEVLTVVEQGQQAPAGLIGEVTAILGGAGLRAHEKWVTGDPKTAIAERAADIKADLIVIGSHRSSALKDLFLSNVATDTIRHAAGSVAVIRPRIDNSIVARKVLLATDGSMLADAAARALANRPWPVRTEVRVLSVVEVILPTMHALFEPPFVNSDEVQKAREAALLQAQNAIMAAVAILAPAGLAVSESLSVLLDGTKEVILKEASDWGADWIIVGSHGRQGTERFLMGSVSEAVAAEAACSVEVVRAPHAKSA